MVRIQESLAWFFVTEYSQFETPAGNVRVEGTGLAAMPNIRVKVRRSDCEENDVSASERHLNERAEERKVEEEQSARLGGAHAQDGGVLAAAPASNNGPPNTKIDHAAATSSSQAAPSAALGTEEGKEGTLEGVQLKKQTSIIQAERTDDESWDAKKTGLGDAVGGWCCCCRRRRESVRAASSASAVV